MSITKTFATSQIKRLSPHRQYGWQSSEALTDVTVALLGACMSEPHARATMDAVVDQIPELDNFPTPAYIREMARSVSLEPAQVQRVIGCQYCLANRSGNLSAVNRPLPYWLPPVAGWVCWVGRNGHEYARRCRCNPEHAASC